MVESSRVTSLEPLRGLAAFAVMWFHFTAANSNFPAGLLKSSGQFGNLGVTVFFVISGFVIPYSLWRGGYQPNRDGFTFFLKRAIRLHPPYVVSLILVIALAQAAAMSPGFRGDPPELDEVDLLAQFLYVSGYLHLPWLNGVAWTLAIECQWYLLAALLQPMLIGKQARYFAPLALIACPLFVASDVAPASIWIIQWLPVFSLGVIIFQLKANLISVKWALLAGLSTSAVCYLCNGILHLVAANVAAFAILFLRLPSTGALGFLGAVSYSVYLLHVPFGSRVINLGTRFADSLLSLSFVLAAAISVSLFAAWMLYRFVEKPASQWSSRLKYAASRSAPPAIAAAEPIANGA